MQIGERIRCLRISKGLTQYDLAQAIHISSSTPSGQFLKYYRV